MSGSPNVMSHLDSMLGSLLGASATTVGVLAALSSVERTHVSSTILAGYAVASALLLGALASSFFGLAVEWTKGEERKRNLGFASFFMLAAAVSTLIALLFSAV